MSNRQNACLESSKTGDEVFVIISYLGEIVTGQLSAWQGNPNPLLGVYFAQER
jgi:hypothetical protein